METGARRGHRVVTLAACIDLVTKGDPDRALVTRAAAEAAQARLWPLYAFNLEAARAPWASHEPLIAQMRLQWWSDALDATLQGNAPKGHPVLVPLQQVITDANLPTAALSALIDARQWDIAREPFADTAALTDHLDATAGGLMWLAAKALGAPPEAEPTVRAAGRASGLAAWLRATPELIARGRQPLPDTSEPAIAALATEALSDLDKARQSRGRVPKSALPALLTGWQTTHVLRLAAAEPARVAQGALTLSEFTRRRILATRGITGRW